MNFMNKTLSQKVSELEETLKIILQISFIHKEKHAQRRKVPAQGDSS